MVLLAILVLVCAMATVQDYYQTGELDTGWILTTAFVFFIFFTLLNAGVGL